MKELKGYVKSWAVTLSSVRDKWADMQKAEKAKQDALLKGAAEAARASLEKKGLLAALLEAQAKLATEFLAKGAGPEAVPLPAGFGEKPKVEKACPEAKPEEEHKIEKKESSGAIVEKIESSEAVAAKEESHKAAAEKEGQSEAKPLETEDAQIVPVKAAPMKAVKAMKLTEDEEVAVQMCIDTWTVEDLRPEYRALYEKVRDTGLGVCPSCRWTSGCLRCFGPKAWSYYVRQELGLIGSKAKPGKKKA